MAACKNACKRMGERAATHCYLAGGVEGMGPMACLKVKGRGGAGAGPQGPPSLFNSRKTRNHCTLPQLARHLAIHLLCCH